MGLHSGRPASVTKHEASGSKGSQGGLEKDRICQCGAREDLQWTEAWLAGDRPVEICWAISSHGEGDRGPVTAG